VTYNVQHSWNTFRTTNLVKFLVYLGNVALIFELLHTNLEFCIPVLYRVLHTYSVYCTTKYCKMLKKVAYSYLTIFVYMCLSVFITLS
jgi:hypothetical protein